MNKATNTDKEEKDQLPTIEHAGMLLDALQTPAYVLPDHKPTKERITNYSCAYCGVGDGGVLQFKAGSVDLNQKKPKKGKGIFIGHINKESIKCEATYHKDGKLEIKTNIPLTSVGGVLDGVLKIANQEHPITIRELERQVTTEGVLQSQTFVVYQPGGKVEQKTIDNMAPTIGCVKIKHSLMRQRVAFPIHMAPSLLDIKKKQRRSIKYEEAIVELANLILDHRDADANILIYGCGQIDYFTIFAIQEVFRILGVRCTTGNAEHCLNAGAVHNEMLTGQEGPFLTIANALEGSNRFYLLNGWNGLITHPPVFGELIKRKNLDAYLVDVVITESGEALAKKLGQERLLLIKPRTDSHLALSIAHQIIKKHEDKIDEQFINRFADKKSFEYYMQLVSSKRFDVKTVAKRIAAEEEYVKRIEKGIKDITEKLIAKDVVPINIPSVGLSQTSGAVAHCVWGNVLALIGKYGLKSQSTPAGGTLRLPGQINAETEVQGLSRNFFMGRIPIKDAHEAAVRMGLPENAYEKVIKSEARAALDYSEPKPGTRELFICIGTQFEANMMERSRWVRKLLDPDTCLVVIEPIPDPFSLEHAKLIIPSPPHPATTKLYQNGEWRLSLLVPQKVPPKETRTDATILYDMMAEITRQLQTDKTVAKAHPDLYQHIKSGYLQKRFLPAKNAKKGLVRIEGEVSRPQLWQRIIDYMSGGCGPLYCRPEHANGKSITWEELIKNRTLIYGGVGENRYLLDTKKESPFGDIYRQPRKFTFFIPTEEDLSYPRGIVLNSGRSSLSNDRKRVLFATGSFNSGKATPIVNMPEEHPLHVSPTLAKEYDLKTGDLVRVTGRVSGGSVILPVNVNSGVKGEVVYVSFHKSLAQIEKGRYINEVTSHVGRCPYTGQTNLKMTHVLIEPVQPPKLTAQSAVTVAMRSSSEIEAVSGVIDTTLLDPKAELPVWKGQESPLFVTDIIKETPNVTTFRFQGNPLCRFVYLPGQFCTLVLNINGKKVLRSYSISSSPTRPFILEITVKRIPGGLVSNWLHDYLKIGDRIDVTGPKGKFCLIPGKIPKKLFFIAAGSGITPLMSMARWLNDISANIDVKFFDSVRTPDDIIYRSELEFITQRSKQFEPIVVTATRTTAGDWMGLSGEVNKNMIEMIAPDINERHIYMCGPPGFMDAVKNILTELDYDLANLYTESFKGIRTTIDNKVLPTYTAPSTYATRLAPSLPIPEKEIKPGHLSIEFVKSEIKSMTDGTIPLLELAEENDVDIDYGCRTGNCGACKVKLLEGEVAMESEEGLTKEEKSNNYILTCVAKPKTHCKLDA